MSPNFNIVLLTVHYVPLVPWSRQLPNGDAKFCKNAAINQALLSGAPGTVGCTLFKEQVLPLETQPTYMLARRRSTFSNS